MSEEAQVALLLCEKHKEEEVDVYCITCKRPTCTKCIKTEHQGHDFDTIPKLYRKIKNKRVDLLRDIKQKSNPVRVKNKRHIRNVRFRNEMLRKLNLENAEKKRAELHQVVDELINSNVVCITTNCEKLDIEIRKEEESLERADTDLDKMIETFEKTTMTGLDLIEYHEKLNAQVESLKIIDVSQLYNRQVYEEGEIDRDGIQAMIGKTKEIQNEAKEEGDDDRNKIKAMFGKRKEIKQHSNKVEMISYFQHRRDSFVGTIVPVSRHEAWITYKGLEEFHYLSKDGKHVKSLKKDTLYHSFCLCNDEFLLVCNADEKNILKVDMSGKSSIWMDTSPLESGFLGEALNGNVLISLRDEYSGARTEKSQRRVKLVSSSGAVLRNYEFEENGTTPLFIHPARVTQNFNADVCVSNEFKDANNQWRGHVCVFFEDGGLNFKYSGHDAKFRPIALCCDLLCNLICANELDDTIHVVSAEGSFIKYLFRQDTCISQPWSLTLKRGVLWVGSWKGEIRVYRYNY